MGVGYSASPLHRISHIDWAAMQGHLAEPGEHPPFRLAITRDGQKTTFDGPMRFRSPSKADILDWRDRISLKYRSQLEEDLSWDEDNAFEQSEDAATSGDMLLRYVAAVLDQRRAGAAGLLVGMAQPDLSQPDNLTQVDAIFAEANRRGFAGSFPQLLLGAHYWFPFERDMMIEEPDWNGSVERYGSSIRLLDELKAVRSFINEAAPGVGRVCTWKDAPPTENVLAMAWEASDLILKLCTSAIAQHVPLWTTG